MMKPLDAKRLPLLPVSGLSRVRDLVYFHGPLLTQFVSAHGDTYLYYWCDRDETSHRWMLIRVDEQVVLRLLHRFVPLDFVIPDGGQDDFVYFVDVGPNSSIKTVWFSKIPAVPEDYRPEKGTFLRDIPRLKNANYPVLIEGQWDARQIMDFPRRFELAYSFLFTTKRLLSKGCFGGIYWHGGAASMHFNRLIANIPTESRLSVQAIQYSSPGFVRFGVDYEIAELVARSVKDRQLPWVQVRHDDLEKYIRSHKIRDIQHLGDPTWDEHRPQLLELAASLAQGFSALNFEEIALAAETATDAVESVRWFYRRTGELSNSASC